MQISEQQEYSWKLEHKDGFRLVGKSITISRDNNAHFKKIPEYWNECQRNGTFAKLISMDAANPKGVFGVFGLFGTYNARLKEIEYSIMVISDQKLPSDFNEIYIPEATWAVFDCIGCVPQSEITVKAKVALAQKMSLEYPVDIIIH